MRALGRRGQLCGDTYRSGQGVTALLNAVKGDGTGALLLNGDKIFCNTLNICL